MLRLLNSTQDYAWGSATAIPELLGRAPTASPVAELWLGAHPSAPSVAIRPGAQEGEPLDTIVAHDPEGALGAEVVGRFGPRLPYLLKVLAAERTLSLQVHPTIAQARAGYDAEDAAGVPLAAPHRSYKDRNHKPELILALTTFDALCGFRQPGEAAELLSGLDAPLARELVRILRSQAESSALSAAVRRLLDGDLSLARAQVDQVVAACRMRPVEDSPDPAADRTAVALAEAYPGDPGVVMSLLLNRVRLAAGRAMFVPAGAVHAYQRGLGVEIMASSDNVLRAGLTAKHVDTAELLATIDYEPGAPAFVEPEPVDESTRVFPVPVDDFLLSVTDLPDDVPRGVPGRGPRILLCLDGTASVTADGETVPVRRGESLFVPAADGPVTVAGPCRLVQADVR